MSMMFLCAHRISNILPFEFLLVVGTFNSNMGLMIVKLMYARNGKVLPNVSLDNFLTSAHKSTCWQENICVGRTEVLVKTHSEDYPMTTSIQE